MFLLVRGHQFAVLKTTQPSSYLPSMVGIVGSFVSVGVDIVDVTPGLVGI